MATYIFLAIYQVFILLLHQDESVKPENLSWTIWSMFIWIFRKYQEKVRQQNITRSDIHCCKLNKRSYICEIYDALMKIWWIAVKRVFTLNTQNNISSLVLITFNTFVYKKYIASINLMLYSLGLCYNISTFRIQ